MTFCGNIRVVKFTTAEFVYGVAIGGTGAMETFLLSQFRMSSVLDKSMPAIAGEATELHGDEVMVTKTQENARDVFKTSTDRRHVSCAASRPLQATCPIIR